MNVTIYSNKKDCKNRSYNRHVIIAAF